MSDDCLFCKISRGEIPSKEVYSDEDVYAFRDINPQAPTHILVIPRRHVPTVSEATAGDEAMLGRLLLRANRIAEQEGLSGFRYVINNGEEAGQTVFHLHLHLLGGRGMKWPPG